MWRWGGGGRDGGDGRSRRRDALRIVDLLVFSYQSYVAFSLPDSFEIRFFVRVICFVRTIWP